MFLPMPDQTIVPCVPDFYASGAGRKTCLKVDVAGGGYSQTPGQTMAKLKLSHTPAEHQLYQTLLDEAAASGTRICAFSTRRLMALAELPNYSAVRRALHGLVNKLSIEDYRIAGDLASLRQATVYLIFSPEEVLARRAACLQAGSKAGAQTGAGYASEFAFDRADQSFDQAIERVTDFHGLSRREAQVALCCVEGLTNTEIGGRLHISEQTVKYHLRHIFVKYKVRRRTELVSRLLSQSVQQEPLRE